MEPTVFFITVLTSLVEIQAHAGEHGNGTVHQSYDGGDTNLVRTFLQKISSSLSLLAIQYIRLLQLEENVLEEL
mgnify:CR=1 FL=1